MASRLGVVIDPPFRLRALPRCVEMDWKEGNFPMPQNTKYRCAVMVPPFVSVDRYSWGHHTLEEMQEIADELRAANRPG
eukprot:70128-Rhodomonas_salina.1